MDKLTLSIERNAAALDAAFAKAGDYVSRQFTAAGDVKCYIAYIDMLTNRAMIEDQLMTKLIYGLGISPSSGKTGAGDLLSRLTGGLSTADLKTEKRLTELITAIQCGDAVLLAEGADEAVVVSAKGWPSRGVPEASHEQAVFGPKEAFSEVFRINTMLLRRRIRDEAFCIEQMRVGRRSKTDIALCYLSDLARPELLDELRERIKRIDLDFLPDSGALQQYIGDSRISPFPALQLTERPDKCASSICEGRVAVIVDGSPFVLLAPAPLVVFYQSSDDYYQHFLTGSFARLLRFLAGLLAVGLPGFYLAAAGFQQSMLPMPLMFKMAAARAHIPIPAVLEILTIEFGFELLSEAGVRLPKPVGSSIGIIGGLIIGQAAVEAGLVSPITVIVVAASAIAGFTIPNYTLFSAFKLVKYFVIALAACFGLPGFWAAMLLAMAHISSIRSFGFPYLYPFTGFSGDGKEAGRDGFLRFPLHMLWKRPGFARPENLRRVSPETSEAVKAINREGGGAK